MNPAGGGIDSGSSSPASLLHAWEYSRNLRWHRGRGLFCRLIERQQTLKVGGHYPVGVTQLQHLARYSPRFARP